MIEGELIMARLRMPIQRRLAMLAEETPVVLSGLLGR